MFMNRRKFCSVFACGTLAHDFEDKFFSQGIAGNAKNIVHSHKSFFQSSSEKYIDIINVKDFGAKGNGHSDDTIAIQQAILNSSLGCIVFPRGIYCISDTLTMTGNANGAYWFLGQSQIKWIGKNAEEDYTSHIKNDMSISEKYNVTEYGWAYYAKPMIYISPALAGIASRCVIEGGTFDGNDRASIAIKIHSFGTLVHGVRIRNVKHCGIALCGANPASAKSGGVMLSDCYIANTRENGLGNSAFRLQHGLKNDVGIYIHDLDNKIINCISNYFGESIVIRSSGNQISNSHTTIQFPYDSDGYIVDYTGKRLLDYPECSNIVVDPDNTTSPSGSNFLNNMYFNSGKYMVYGKNNTNMSTMINGGAYFLKSKNIKIYGKKSTTAFLYGGSVMQPLHVSGLACHHPAYFQVYDYYPDAKIANTFMDTTLDIVHNSNPSGISLIDANNLVSQISDDPIQITSLLYPIKAGRYALVGCILSFIQESSNISDMIIYEIFHLNQSSVKGSLFFNKKSNKWEVKNASKVYGEFFSTSFFIDNNPHTKIINNRQYLYYNLYFGSNKNDMNKMVFLNMRSKSKLSKIYLFRMHNYSNGIYITDIPQNHTSLMF